MLYPTELRAPARVSNSVLESWARRPLPRGQSTVARSESRLPPVCHARPGRSAAWNRGVLPADGLELHSRACDSLPSATYTGSCVSVCERLSLSPVEHD